MTTETTAEPTADLRFKKGYGRAKPLAGRKTKSVSCGSPIGNWILHSIALERIVRLSVALRAAVLTIDQLDQVAFERLFSESQADVAERCPRRTCLVSERAHAALMALADRTGRPVDVLLCLAGKRWSQLDTDRRDEIVAKACQQEAA
jgi:hypothetical protein